MTCQAAAIFLACMALAAPPALEAPARVEVPLAGGGEVDLGELAARLADATGVQIERPPAGATLPVTGLAGRLSRTVLGDALGPDARLSVERRSLVVSLAPPLLSPARRAEWEGRVRDLAARAGREARRRMAYGMRARPSYRPDDPGRPTVCLVHGVNSDSGGFVHMIPLLEQAGFGVVTYDYPFNRSLEESGRRFARDWSAFRRATGDRRPWTILGHSMGCLVARDYVEGPSFAGDVSRLILVAPVNQGSHLAKTQTLLQLIHSVQAVNDRRASDALAHLGDGLGEAANDMLPGSRYLRALNARPRRARVAYHIVAGDVGILPTSARARIEAQAAVARRQGGLLAGVIRLAAGNPETLADRLDEVTDGTGDGCVSVARTRLDGVTDHVVIHANHAELIRAPLLFRDPGPVACMPQVLKWLGRPGGD